MLLLILPALAEERINLSTEGSDQLYYRCTLPDGRVIFAGSAAIPGNYQDSRARLLCMNTDGSVAWDYRHPAKGNCSFGSVQLLPDGQLGVTFSNSPDQSTKEVRIFRFTTEGEPVGESIDIFTPDYLGSGSTSECICYSVLPGDAQSYYHYFIDWSGRMLFRLHSECVASAFTVLPAENGVVLAGQDNRYPSPSKLVKLDLYGNILWETFIPTVLPNADARLEDITPLPDGSYLSWVRETAGDIISDGFQTQCSLIRLDADGVLLWRTPITPEMTTQGRSKAITVFQDKIVVALPSDSYDGTSPYPFLWFDMNGTYLGQTAHSLEPGEGSYGTSFVTLGGRLWALRDVRHEKDTTQRTMDTTDEFLIPVPEL